MIHAALKIFKSPILLGIYMCNARYFLLTGLWENILKTLVVMLGSLEAALAVHHSEGEDAIILPA